MFRKDRLKRKSSLEKEESDRRKQILFEREEFYQRGKGRLKARPALKEMVRFKRDVFLWRVVKREDLYWKGRARVLKNMFDPQKRDWIKQPDFASIFGFKKNMNRNNYLKHGFCLERTTLKRKCWKGWVQKDILKRTGCFPRDDVCSSGTRCY